MTDADILDAHQTVGGIIVEHIRVNPAVRAGILGMPKEIYSARHPSGWIAGMGVAATEEEAIAKLVSHYPELKDKQ